MAIYVVTGVITEYVEEFIEADSEEEAVDRAEMFANVYYPADPAPEWKVDRVDEITPERLIEYFKGHGLDESFLKRKEEDND